MSPEDKQDLVKLTKAFDAETFFQIVNINSFTKSRVEPYLRVYTL